MVRNDPTNGNDETSKHSGGRRSVLKAVAGSSAAITGIGSVFGVANAGKTGPDDPPEGIDYPVRKTATTSTPETIAYADGLEANLEFVTDVVQYSPTYKNGMTGEQTVVVEVGNFAQAAYSDGAQDRPYVGERCEQISEQRTQISYDDSSNQFDFHEDKPWIGAYDSFQNEKNGSEMTVPEYTIAFAVKETTGAVAGLAKLTPPYVAGRYLYGLSGVIGDDDTAEKGYSWQYDPPEEKDDRAPGLPTGTAQTGTYMKFQIDKEVEEEVSFEVTDEVHLGRGDITGINRIEHTVY